MVCAFLKKKKSLLAFLKTVYSADYCWSEKFIILKKSYLKCVFLNMFFSKTENRSHNLNKLCSKIEVDISNMRF